MIITIKRPSLREQLSDAVSKLLRHEYGRDFENIASLCEFDGGRIAYPTWPLWACGPALARS